MQHGWEQAARVWTCGPLLHVFHSLLHFPVSLHCFCLIKPKSIFSKILHFCTFAHHLRIFIGFFFVLRLVEKLQQSCRNLVKFSLIHFVIFNINCLLVFSFWSTGMYSHEHVEPNVSYAVSLKAVIYILYLKYSNMRALTMDCLWSLTQQLFIFIYPSPANQFRVGWLLAQLSWGESQSAFTEILKNIFIIF